MEASLAEIYRRGGRTNANGLKLLREVERSQLSEEECPGNEFSTKNEGAKSFPSFAAMLEIYILLFLVQFPFSRSLLCPNPTFNLLVSWFRSLGSGFLGQVRFRSQMGSFDPLNALSGHPKSFDELLIQTLPLD